MTSIIRIVASFRWPRRLVPGLGALALACGDGDARDDTGVSCGPGTVLVGNACVPANTSDPATEAGTDASTGAPTTGDGVGETGLPTSGASTGEPPPGTTTGDDTTTSADDTTGPALPPPFTPGHVFVIGWNDRKVFEYDATLQSVTSWSHPSFEGMIGPAGMVFDYRGHLVVAAYDQFCIFSAPDEVETCHPKIVPESTENIIFDISRNLYTTTATGGSDQIQKYDENYNHLATFDLPTGNLTGITCDPSGDLFVASQTNPQSTVYKIDRTNLEVLDSFTVPGNAEGLQYGPDGNLLVALSAGVGIVNVTPGSPSMVLSTTAYPSLLWPVPLTIDQAGNRYTGDFEDGSGVAAADLYVFAPDGSLVASRVPAELHGPFGLVVAGVHLPCGAVPL